MAKAKDLEESLVNIEEALGGEEKPELRDLGEHLEYIEELIEEGGGGGEGKVNDVQVNGVSVLDHKVADIELKTVDGQSITGEGNVEIKSYKTFDQSWRTDGTTKQFCDDINADEDAIVGMEYLGGVTFTDFPASGLVNADVVVDIIAMTAGKKVIRLTMTSGSVSPYHWEYTYWSDGAHVSGWQAWQPTLVSGSNIKTINNTSLLGSGDIEITAGDPNVDIILINPQSISQSGQTNIPIDEETYNKLADLDNTATIVRIDYTEGSFRETLDLHRTLGMFTASTSEPYEVVYTTGKINNVGEFVGVPIDFGEHDDPRYVFAFRPLGATIWNTDIISEIKSGGSSTHAPTGYSLQADGSGNTIWAAQAVGYKMIDLGYHENLDTPFTITESLFNEIMNNDCGVKIELGNDGYFNFAPCQSADLGDSLMKQFYSLDSEGQLWEIGIMSSDDDPPEYTVMGISFGRVLNYNNLTHVPVINQDLDDGGFTPVANAYYRHSGYSATNYEIGKIYFYDGANFNAIDGSGSGGTSDYDALENKPIINQTVSTEPVPFENENTLYVGDKIHFDKSANWTDFFESLSYGVEGMVELTSGLTLAVVDLSNFGFSSGDYTIFLNDDYTDQDYFESIYSTVSGTLNAGGDPLPLIQGWNPHYVDANGDLLITETEGDSDLTLLDTGDWNGTFIGLISTAPQPAPIDGKIYHRDEDLYKYTESTSSLKPIEIGDTITTGTKLHFNTSAALYSKLEETLSNLMGTDSRKCLIRLGLFNYNNGLVAEKDGDNIQLVAYNSMVKTVLYSSGSGSGYVAGWQNLDADDEYTFTNVQSGQTDVQVICDYVPFEWNGVFVGYNEATIIKKFNKYVTAEESLEIYDLTVLGELIHYPLTEAQYNRLLNNDNIVIKYHKGGGSTDPLYAQKAAIVDANDGTNYWKLIYYICSYTNGSEINNQVIIDWNEYEGYYISMQNGNTLPYTSSSANFWDGSSSCQSINSYGSFYNIKEAIYTFSSTISDGDVLDPNNDYEAIQALTYHYPVVANDKRYEFQRKETNGSSQDVDTYMTSYLNGNLAHISIMQYNESTGEVTFKEQDVNGGVAYQTTVPTGPNTDGTLKFVVLTQAQATGITKYAGYLYYITD